MILKRPQRLCSADTEKKTSNSIFLHFLRKKKSSSENFFIFVEKRGSANTKRGGAFGGGGWERSLISVFENQTKKLFLSSRRFSLGIFSRHYESGIFNETLSCCRIFCHHLRTERKTIFLFTLIKTAAENERKRKRNSLGWDFPYQLFFLLLLAPSFIRLNGKTGGNETPAV